VSLSGGLDSSVLTTFLAKHLGPENVYAISFNYNQRHDIELTKAQKTVAKLGVSHKIIDINFLGDLVSGVSAMVKGDVATPTMEDIIGDPQPVTYVPFRNLILASLTMSYAESVGATGIAMGIQNIDAYSYWDTTPAFAEALQNITNLNRKHLIQILTPFVNYTKVEEIELGNEIEVAFEDTHTCYNPNEAGESCGVCPSCMERLAAFKKAGMVDPVPYQEK
jgi:7-cyano-7-deazaguanine synthase